MDNINKIVEKLFSELPKEENSIILQLEEETYFKIKDEYDNYMFDILCLITLGGIEYLYGHRNILELTESQFDNISRYIKSINYKIKIETNGLDETPWELNRLDIPIKNYKLYFIKNI